MYPGNIDKAYQPSELKVNVGDHNYRTRGETTLEQLNLRLAKIHRHNNFKQVIGAKSATGNGWDIAILELPGPTPNHNKESARCSRATDSLRQLPIISVILRSARASFPSSNDRFSAR